MTTLLEVAEPDIYQVAVECIDAHLAGIPAGRDLVSMAEHTDVLLDLRLLFAKESASLN